MTDKLYFPFVALQKHHQWKGEAGPETRGVVPPVTGTIRLMEETGATQSNVKACRTCTHKCANVTCCSALVQHLLAQLLPALEEVTGGHFSWLEELVDGDRKLESQVLQSSSIPTHTHTHFSGYDLFLEIFG